MKAEKRFLSTIARRLDTLGAITKGQRQTGGQGLFRPEDNLESHYARDALRQLYVLLVMGKVEGCSPGAFEEATGLKLTDSTGIRDELPPITTFLNRLLALTIDLQNILFTAFEQLLTARIEGAIASGTYDVGLETLTAESFVVTGRQTIYTHPGTSAETRLLTITQRERNRPVTLDEALGRLSDPRALLLVNSQSGRAAVQVPAPSLMLDDGEVERRVRLIRPMEHPAMPLAMMLRRTGGKPTAKASPAPGRPNSPRCRSSPTARSISSSVSCCRSGSVCRTNRRGSIGSRPMPANASSVARFRRHGSPARLRSARRTCRPITPSPR